ncbi:MAG: tyrosine-type recombinase/integrase [Gemmatimonadaceae bacterium]|nr:tyrosine-type recombinase/integrase [Gemmatimonadaceae bacterium]
MTTTHEAVTQYVVYRQAAGADFRATARLLDAFCRAVGPDVAITAIPVERVRAFVDGRGPVTRYWHRKQSTLRGFYRYAVSHRLVAHAPLSSIIPKQPPSFVPYLFTRDEVRRLLEATDRYRRGRFHLEPHTFRALLLLLYGAGLRIGEALRLTLADVDLPAALLTIRDTKFYKTRLVPIGPDLCGALRHYAERRAGGHALWAPESAFLVDRKGLPLRDGTVRQAFAQLRRCAGISRTDGAQYQPRLHDFRHAFAGHRLTAWYRAGADVQRLLPQLSTYLGHVSIAATQVYLTMTPELLREACIRFGHYADLEGAHAR